jgi:hypothetical protein
MIVFRDMTVPPAVVPVRTVSRTTPGKARMIHQPLAGDVREPRNSRRQSGISA